MISGVTCGRSPDTDSVTDNNEGTPSASGAQNGAYGGGSPAFLKILEDWRAKDDFDGLDVRKFEN